jgi:ATP-dependent exoDNAse (exonuclease V) beta subunit
VWWDPGVLHLGRRGRQGVRREDLLSREVEDEVVQRDTLRYRTWESARAKAIEASSEPTVRPETVRERAARSVHGGEEPTAGVETIELPRRGRRPTGRRFGALVHAVLATVPLAAGEDAARSTAEMQGRVLGATPEEVRAAGKLVLAVLRHELLERAREAASRGDCRRETPVSRLEEDGVLVEGVVDLAFREKGSWTVVDFKTDRDVEHDLPVHREQVALYASMVAAATGEPVKAVLLVV